MDSEILKALLKRAKGYTYNEVQDEYSVDENGDPVLVKRKVLEKYCPPDSTALKAYLELTPAPSTAQMSDEDLQKEKRRLLAELGRLQLEENMQTQKNNTADSEKAATSDSEITPADSEREASIDSHKSASKDAVGEEANACGKNKEKKCGPSDVDDLSEASADASHKPNACNKNKKDIPKKNAAYDGIFDGNNEGLHVVKVHFVPKTGRCVYTLRSGDISPHRPQKSGRVLFDPPDTG